MALDTDFNVSPFYDDYNETKNFHRVLFRPAVPIQARELTQLQTILQNQVERFGDNIYIEGTIIKGCSFTFDNNYQYIKLQDLQVDGQSTLVSNYANSIVKSSSSNLQAIVINQVQGLQSQNPDLSTLFIKYTNSGTAGEKQFSVNETLTSFTPTYSIQDITVTSIGAGYSNSDVVVFAGGGGTGASANIVTYTSNGSIRDVIITGQGSGYTTAPTLSFLAANGAASSGAGGSLEAFNYIARIRVANSSFTNAVGVGYALTVSDGIIYQKGHFVRVAEQTTIVSKYTNQPNNVSVGFTTVESIVNNSIDSTILDNAQGYSNYTAPGAYRLKLQPQLISISTTAAASNSEFLSLMDFENGRVTRRRTNTQFNSVGVELARRTAEESGNYVLNPFKLYTEEKSGNTTYLNLAVAAGSGYVSGYKVEVGDTIRLPIKKGSTTVVDSSQTITTNYGNYVLVSEVLGVFDFTTGPTVSLKDAVSTDVTDNFGGAPSTSASTIGTARVRSIVYDSGTVGTSSCRYRLYLFDVRMQSGKTFSNVRAIQLSTTGIADVVLEGTPAAAVLKDASYDYLVFPSGAESVKAFTNEQFIYRAVGTTTIATTGIGTVTLSGSESFPYSNNSTLNDTQERDFIVIPSANVYSTTNLSGTVTSSGNTITGTSTSFLTQLAVGDYVKFSGNTTYFRVTELVSATSMKVNGTGPAISANTLSYGYVKNVPVRLDRTGASVSIDITGKIASINLGNTVFSSTAASVVHNAKVTNAAQKTKTVYRNANAVFVKLSTTSLTTSNTGPWCLGIPDAFKIEAVYVGSANTYVATGTNRASSFELISGQTDNLYGLSYIRKKPGSTLSLTSSSSLLVKVSCFTHGSGYYLSTESYPVNDAGAETATATIKTQDIPYFQSPKTGKYFNLRDVIDFRPIVANTANVSNASTVGGASIDPITTETLTGTFYFPTPDKDFQADIEHYLRRIDRIVIDPSSTVKIVEGIPALNPNPPKQPDTTMTLGVVHIPPYPSLSPQQASEAQRSEYSTLVQHDQVRGYTMKDIKQIEDRINRLEYYSLLNTLEKDTKDLVIPSESNSSISRFKNGFFVDSFNNYDISNLSDAYTIAIDTTNGVARPQINKYVIDLQPNTASSSNVAFVGDYALLEYDQAILISQTIANSYRNPVQLQYSYNGVLNVFPKYDNYYDVTQGSQNVTIDLATPLNGLVDTINNNVQFKKDGAVVTSSVGTGNWSTVSSTNLGGGATTQLQQRETIETVATTVTTLKPSDSKLSVQPVGSFVTNFGLNPYIREQNISFVVTGLRPLAEHKVFFDKVDVSSQTRPAIITNLESVNSKGLKFDTNATITGALGATLKTDDAGTLVGEIHINSNQFFVGSRDIVVADVQNYDDIDQSISIGKNVFNAFNFYKDITDLTLTTKTPGQLTPSSNTSISTRAGTEQRNITVPAPQPRGCCFIRGTTITLADGSTKSIEDVEIGDKLIGKDNSINIVIDFIRPLLGDRTLVSLNGSVPFMTNDHPVYMKDGTWKSFNPEATKKKYEALSTWDIGKLQVGDVIETVDRVGLEIVDISEHINDPDLQVYNFTLDGNNTYIANGLVVHNKGAGAGGTDPLAQTFRIDNSDGTHGVYLTKLDLYFKSKDSTLGATVQIRETDNGYPATAILGSRYLKSSSINTSDTASSVTAVTFDTPIYLSSGKDYCFVIIPDQNNPNYLLWTAEVGMPDIADSSLVYVSNWGAGVMFLSSNDTAWTPVQREDVKFTIYCAKFTKNTGTLVLENKPYEFLSVSNTYGSFQGGEEIAQKSNTYINATFTCNTTSQVVNTSTSLLGTFSVGDYGLFVYGDSLTSNKTGTVTVLASNTTVVGTTTVFETEYTVGDYIKIDTSIREVTAIASNTTLTIDAPLLGAVAANTHKGASKSFQVQRINAANSSTITVKDYPSKAIDNSTVFVGVQKVVRAVMSSVGNDETVVLEESNAANTTFLFQANKSIIGEASGATSTISSVDDIVVNYAEAHILDITPPTTSTSYTMTVDQTASAAPSSIDIIEGVTNKMAYEAEVKSRSNEIANSNNKSLKFNVSMARNDTALTKLSPAVDLFPASIISFNNIINNSATNETTGYGNASVRYISKNVVLAEGLDAEDMKVFLTAYKPPTSTIQVYSKILSSDDPDVFKDKDWTLMSASNNSNLFSDSLNDKDYIEFEYSFPRTPPSTALAGIITSATTTTLTGSGSAFNTDLVANDIIKIVQSDTETSYDIGVVDAVTNATNLTLKSNTSFSGACSIEKVTQKKAAFKYNRESNIVTYFDASNGRHSSYKVFAIKVVLLSSTTQNPPIMKDVRALAVSI